MDPNIREILKFAISVPLKALIILKGGFMCK